MILETARPQCFIRRSPDREILDQACDSRYHPDIKDCPLFSKFSPDLQVHRTWTIEGWLD